MQQLSTFDASALGGMRGQRAELLIALKKAPHPLTAKELAVQFGLTPNALRRHLRSLEDEALVRYAREVRGVGAPVYAYSLTEAGQALFPQGYASVLTALLEAVREAAGADGVRAAIRRQWAPLVEDARPRLAELPLEERAQLVAELRSAQGYMAQAVVGAPGPDGPGEIAIREHHCAVREVAGRFPEICAAEQELMEELLGVPLERTHHMVSGCTACVYRARLPADAAPASDAAQRAPSFDNDDDTAPVGSAPGGSHLQALLEHDA